jgi:glycine hydroxymethyltransferase
LRPEFRAYAAQIVENAQALAAAVKAGGFDLVAGGTDTHVVLVDLRPKDLTGKASEAALERAGFTCNKNGVPFDPKPPATTSGIRLGSPAGTTRGFKAAEFTWIGSKIVEVLDALKGTPDGNPEVEMRVREEVRAMCARFPIY